jgi:hypothetical protein
VFVHSLWLLMVAVFILVVMILRKLFKIRSKENLFPGYQEGIKYL